MVGWWSEYDEIIAVGQGCRAFCLGRAHVRARVCENMCVPCVWSAMCIAEFIFVMFCGCVVRRDVLCMLGLLVLRAAFCHENVFEHIQLCVLDGCLVVRGGCVFARWF